MASVAADPKNVDEFLSDAETRHRRGALPGLDRWPAKGMGYQELSASLYATAQHGRSKFL